MDTMGLFDRDFEAVLADTEQAKRIHHEIRYQVFCEETGFEDRQAFPDRLEADQWDERAIPFLVRTKQTQEWVGTMRLILPGQNLPAQQLCMMDRGAVARIKPYEVGEVSRLCVLSSYRNQRPRLPAALRRTRPTREQDSQIMLGLLRAAAGYSREQGIRYWYILTTNALARLMSSLCMPLSRVGDGIEHRGQRFPYLAHIERNRKRAGQLSPAMQRMLSHPTPYLRCSELMAQEALEHWQEEPLAMPWSA